MFEYLLLLLIIGLLASPLLLAWPRPAVRRREQIRMKLLAAGLRVKMSERPGGQSPASVASTPMGAWYLQDFSRPCRIRLLALRSDKQWDISLSENLQPRQLERVLSAVPQWIGAIRIDADELGLWWDEKWGPERLEQMRALFATLQSELDACSLFDSP